MGKILIIDDDKDIAELVSLILRKEKIESDIITDSLEALKVLETGNYNYDLILLDIMMPNISGTELCIKVRDKVSCPIVFLSAKKELVDKMVGYEIGGDDYITKPFNNAELLARIKVHLRKTNTDSKDIITIDDVEINKKSYSVVCNNKNINLSKIEFDILKLLMENNNQVVTKSILFDNVWGNIDSADENTLNVHISKIRNKLKKANPNKDYIETIWSIGYKFKN